MGVNHQARPVGAVIRHIVVHTNQGPNPPNQFPDLSAENLAVYLTSTGNTRDPVSYHVLVDDDSLLVYLPDNQEAWAAFSSNPIGLHLCFVGMAEWDRAEWLRHPRMLQLAADKVRQWCGAYGIPMIKLTPHDVSLNFWGIIGHVDWTIGKKDGTHSDPGPNFPWDVFINLVKQGVPDMDAEQNRKLDETHDIVTRMIPSRAGNPKEDPKNPYRDTVLGYAANADGYGWRIEKQAIPALTARLDAMDQKLNVLLDALAKQTKPSP